MDQNSMNEEQIVIYEKEERRREIERIFNPDNCQVIRKELFASMRDPEWQYHINTACIKDLDGVVYVKLLYDRNLKFLSVTECDENDKHALRWCVARTDKRKSRRMRCPEFTGPLFEQLGWSSKRRYKMLGYKIEFEGKIFYVLDLNVPQIFNEKPKKGEEELDENGEVVEVDTRTGFYPDNIANTFGVPMAQYKKETESTDIDGLCGDRQGLSSKLCMRFS